MNHPIRRTITALICLVLLGGLGVSQAAPATVHLDIYKHYIYIDSKIAGFSNVQGRETYPFSYNGTVYIPADTAAVWLGCRLTVDLSAGTAALRSGEEATIPDRDSPLFDLEVDGERIDRYFDEGVEAQLLSGFTVTVDGTPWTFSNPLLLVEGTLYLPLRSVGERMGKTVTWVPEPTDVHHYETELISIDTPVTAEQLTEMQTYLDLCYGFYEEASALGQELVNAQDLSAAEAAGKLEQMENLLRQIGRTSPPSCSYLNKYEFSILANDPIVMHSLTDFAADLRAGTTTFQELQEKDRLQPAVNAILMGRYANLNDAQHGLDCLRAAMGAG